MTLFSQRLKWLRDRKKLTQKEMAEKIGVSQQYYNKFEKGTGEPNLTTLWRIRHVIDETLDFMIGVYFEDVHADQLYELYAEARQRREETEADIAYYESELPKESGKKAEFSLKMLRQFRDEVRSYRAKEEKAFNIFFEHISTIPGFEGEFAIEQYWINKYPDYIENDRRLYHEFLEDLHKL